MINKNIIQIGPYLLDTAALDVLGFSKEDIKVAVEKLEATAMSHMATRRTNIQSNVVQDVLLNEKLSNLLGTDFAGLGLQSIELPSVQEESGLAP